MKLNKVIEKVVFILAMIIILWAVISYFDVINHNDISALKSSSDLVGWWNMFKLFF